MFYYNQQMKINIIKVYITTACLCTLHCYMFRHFFHVIVRQSTGVLLSPQPGQEGKKLQRPNFNVCKPLKKKNSESCPSNQVSAAAMTSGSEEKWRLFNCFFQSGRARDLSAPLYSQCLAKSHNVLQLAAVENVIYTIKML